MPLMHRSSGRTPLFSLSRRWIRAAHEANVSGKCAEEILTHRQGVTRRGVLGTALAVAAAPRAVFAAAGPKVVVVGAGMAGLNATYQLKKKGVRAELYEGSGRTGGRMYTARGVMGNGLTTELGGEFIDSIHRDMRDLCREFGLALRDFEKPSERSYDTTYFFGGSHLTEAQVIAAFQPVADLMAQDQADFVFDSYQSYNQLAYDLDHTPIADYLTQVGATGWLYDLLDVAYNIEYGLETDQQSSLNLLYLIGTSTNQGLELFGESDERFTIEEGNDALTSALACEVDDRTTLGHKLVAVQGRGNGFRLTFQKTGGGFKQVDCDYCLLTLPFTMLRQVDIQVQLSPQKRQAIDELGYGTNSKLILGFGNRIWRADNLNGEWFTDNGAQSGWDSTRLQSGQAGSLTCYSGGQNGLAVGAGTPEHQRNLVLPKLEALFPGASASHNGKVVRFHWPSHPWSLGSYACYKVGQYTQFSGAEFENAGRLYFAGEHCSSDFQGYMNGAAETGRKAANQIWKKVK